MNDENKCIKIAYVTAQDAQDRRTASGTTYHMARALQKHCGEVSFFSPIPPQLKEMLIGKVLDKCSRLFLRKNYMPLVSFLFARRYAKYLTQRLAEESFDVIVSLGATEIVLLGTDIPIVLLDDSTFALLYNFYPNWSNVLKGSIRRMDKIESLALKKARRVIYSSEWAARSAIEDYSADPTKIHVVQFGANLDISPPREVALARKKSDRCRLLFLAIDWVRKGGDIAFETLLKLEEMGIQAELIICGCTPPKMVVHERATVIPFLNKNDERRRKEIEKLLMLADFLLLPTRADCTPIVFCEASAFGLPVITTRTGGVPEVIRDGENGFALPYDARGDAYAEVIAKVYQDDQFYSKLMRSSRAAYDERLNWDTWGIAVKKLITEMLDQKNAYGNAHSSFVDS